MSFDYSSGSVKEILLDTNSFSQSRCEFRVPADMSVLSNLKLVNLGAFRTGGDNQFYNRGAGVAGLIKNISLMDGAQVLSECRQVSKQLSFRNFNNTNNVNQSYKSPMLLSGASYAYSLYDLDSSNNVVAKGYEGIAYNGNSLKVTTTEATTSKGLLVLSDILPILNKMEMLDNNLFKNGLRLVIEWETERLKMTTNINGTLTIIQPILCMYQVVGDDLYNELKVSSGLMSWYEREVDQKNYAATAVETQRFSGFNNKRVLRFVVAKEYQASANYLVGTAVKGFGRSGSVSVLNEFMNFSSNGQNIFPNVVNRNDMSRQVVNAFGACVGYQGFNQVQSVDAAGFPQYNTIMASASVATGDFGYSACQINNDVVKDLEIRLSRTIPANPVCIGHNDALTVFVFGDVAKVLSISNGSYTISYA